MDGLAEKTEEAAGMAQKLAALVYNLRDEGNGTPNLMMKNYAKCLKEISETVKSFKDEQYSFPSVVLEAVDGRDHPEVILSRLLQSLKDKSDQWGQKRKVLFDFGRKLADSFELRSVASGTGQSAAGVKLATNIQIEDNNEDELEDHVDVM